MGQLPASSCAHALTGWCAVPKAHGWAQHARSRLALAHLTAARSRQWRSLHRRPLPPGRRGGGGAARRRTHASHCTACTAHHSDPAARALLTPPSARAGLPVSQGERGAHMGTQPALSRRRLHRAARALQRCGEHWCALPSPPGPAQHARHCLARSHHTRLCTLPAPARSAPRIPAPALLASAPITRLCTLSAPALPAPALPAPARPSPLHARSPHAAIGPHAQVLPVRPDVGGAPRA